MLKGEKNKMKVLSVFGEAITVSNEIKKEVGGILLTAFGLILSVLTLIEGLQINSIVLSTGLSVAVSFLFLIIKYNYYRNHGKVITRGTTTITVKFGDIFKEKGVKLIPCEGKFEKENDNVISRESIQWKCLSDIKDSIKTVENCDKTKYFEHTDVIGKNCVCVFSIIDLDEQNIAKCTTEEYIQIILKLCKLIEKIAKKREVIIPIIGSGFKKIDRDMDSIDCLNLILTILKLYSFNRETQIKIIIYEKKHTMKDINLFLVK